MLHAPLVSLSRFLVHVASDIWVFIQLVDRTCAVRATSEPQPGDVMLMAKGRLEPGVVAQGCGCVRVFCGSAPPTKAPRGRAHAFRLDANANLFCLLPVVQPHAECGMKIQPGKLQVRG